MCLQLRIRKVRTKARLVEGDAGKVICREADRLKPAAVILGTRGRGLIQRYRTLKPPNHLYICGTFRYPALLNKLYSLWSFDLTLYPANFAVENF